MVGSTINLSTNLLNIIHSTDARKEVWNQYVYSLPEAHFCHDYRWREVIEKSFAHTSYYLMAVKDSRVMGILPLFFMKSCFFKPCLISMPFLNYGGIVAEDKTVADALLSEASKIQKEVKAAYIELRHFAKRDLDFTTREHKVTMILDLKKNVEDQWAKLDKKVRNQIRKAEKSDLTVRQGKGELLAAFYKVFCRNMRDLGTPVLGRHFFENILQAFPEESNIVVVSHKGKPIAVAFTLKHHDIVEIPWASSIRDYDKLCPNMLLYWEVIKHAILSGYRQFDFGRCTKDSGTYFFKKQWNPSVHQLYWQYDAKNASMYDSCREKKQNKIFFLLWRNLPNAIANTFGPSLARIIPIF